MAKILVVEDEPILALELSEDLKARGHEVFPPVKDGDQSILAVSQYKPDLIIMDIKLYGFRDGIDASARLRGFFSTPILYLSSYPLQEVKTRVMRTQPAWYLEKPYNEEKLMNAIDGILAGTLPPLN